MGLFTRKKKIDTNKGTLPGLPALPELPGHSDFPEIPIQTPGELLNIKNKEEKTHQLPSFPSNSLGEKNHQDIIKTAIGTPLDKEIYEYDEINDDENLPKMIPEKVKRPTFNSLPELNTTKIKNTIEEEMHITPKIKSADPIFIRIDKFEESLKVFQTVKRKISEIEELLKDTKEIKKREEEVLNSWEDEILQLKTQIGKVDKDIFSKVE